MAATFEHKVLTFQMGWKGFDYTRIEKELDELGHQGWEVVGTLAPSVGGGHTQQVGVILKRQRT